ncbi:MAG: hypothetical protein C4321_06315 [Chloroflexota bacterium]
MGGLVLMLRGQPLLLTVVLGAAAYAGLLFVLGILGQAEVHFVWRLCRPVSAPLAVAPTTTLFHATNKSD